MTIAKVYRVNDQRKYELTDPIVFQKYRPLEGIS